MPAAIVVIGGPNALGSPADELLLSSSVVRDRPRIEDGEVVRQQPPVESIRSRPISAPHVPVISGFEQLGGPRMGAKIKSRAILTCKLSDRSMLLATFLI
jgi:hypothetical protein